MSYIVLMQAGYMPAVFTDKDVYNLMWSSRRKLRQKLFFDAVVEGNTL